MCVHVCGGAQFFIVPYLPNINNYSDYVYLKTLVL